jgi:MoxR-like ATPase
VDGSSHEGALFAELANNITPNLIGHQTLVERLVTAFLANGHVLLEGPPGIAKTRAVKELAKHLPGTYARIQCTPDLMPADLTGTRIFRRDSNDFEFAPGPVFHSLVLVDEINRSPPKVQSALLEAMAEHHVTVGGTTRALPDPFMVIATQNPIEHEGTFPLPEAQLDRFLLHLHLGLPNAEDELKILDLVEHEAIAPPQTALATLPPETIAAAKAQVARIHLSPLLKDFIVRLVTATRTAPFLEHIEHPVSPRGTLALAACARARGWLMGRDHALPEDVEAVAEDALGHRLVPSWEARAEGKTGRALVRDILETVRPW